MKCTFTSLIFSDGEWAGEIPQAEHSVRVEHHRTPTEIESNRKGDAPWETKGMEPDVERKKIRNGAKLCLSNISITWSNVKGQRILPQTLAIC